MFQVNSKAIISLKMGFVKLSFPEQVMRQVSLES